MSELVLERGLPADTESERLILGAVQVGNDFGLVASTLDPRDFAIEKHRRIFAAMKALYDRGEPIDRVTLARELMNRGQLESVDGLSYLVSLDDGMPQIANLDAYVEIVRDKSTLRQAITRCQQTIDDCLMQNQPTGEILARCERMISDLTGETIATGLLSVLDVVAGRGGISGFVEPARRIKGIETPWGRLNQSLEGGGLLPGQMVVIGGRPGSGKAQPLTSSVLTDCGWRKMEDIQIGDRLASHDGLPSEVTGVFPQGQKAIYTVTFSDGRQVQCCPDHLWSVRYREWPENRVLPTRKIKAMLERRRYQKRLFVPLFRGDFGKRSGLPINPWLMGYLLGNGNFFGGTPRVSCSHVELVEKITRLLKPLNLELVFDSGVDFRMVQRGGANLPGTSGVLQNPLTGILKDLGLYEKYSFEKFVPGIYLNARRSVRLELLSGLLDSDGTVGEKGGVSFSSSSPKLASDVEYLARSLGGLARSRLRATPRYTYLNEHKEGRPSYLVSVSPLAEDAPFVFSHPFKCARISSNRAQRSLTITSVVEAGEEDCQCISVSHPSGLYITDNFATTHNTALACNIATKTALEGRGTALFSLEMSDEAIMRRLLGAHARVDQLRYSQGRGSSDDRTAMESAMRDLVDGENCKLWITSKCYTLPSIRASLCKLTAKNPISLVVIDYLQLVETSGGSEKRRWEQMSDISRQIKRLAEEFRVPVIALAQLNRENEREQRTPRLSDLRDSGSIEQDGDLILFPYVLPDKEQAGGAPGDMPFVDLVIAKQRNGHVGKIPLMFSKRFTLFEER